MEDSKIKNNEVKALKSLEEEHKKLSKLDNKISISDRIVKLSQFEIDCILKKNEKQLWHL